jgi:ribosomal protein S16
MGAKKRPFYRVVVADQREARDGRFIENIGKYHPLEDPSLIEIDEERAVYWLGTGAQPERGRHEPPSGHRHLGPFPGGEEGRRVRGCVLRRARGVVKDILEYIAKELVEHPDAVEVKEFERERSVQLQLRVDPEDMGKVIGKGGRTVRAIRTVLKAAGTRAGVNPMVEIVE